MRPSVHWQRGLQHFNGAMFQPDSSTAGGKGLGGIWTTDTAAVGITVAHATVGTAFDTQLKRTTYANVVGAPTPDQELGPRLSSAGDYQFWFGNAANLGGWYMSAIFRIGTWNNDGGRLFVGMTASTNPVCISDTVPNHTIGLWHDSTDGQDVLSLVNKTTGASAKLAISDHTSDPGLLATGVTLLWEMWAFPNSINAINTNFKLQKFDPTNRTIANVEWNAQGGGPSTTTMCAPQVQMSNGADTTAAHFKIEVANVYCVAYSGELFNP